MAAANGGEGWDFIEPTDEEFLAAHPELAQDEAQRWTAIAPWLEADPTSGAEMPAYPVPAAVDPAAAGKAQMLVLPTVVSNAVIKLSAIRAGAHTRPLLSTT